MGMYTEFVMAVNLRSNTPNTVIDILKFMIGERETPPIGLGGHPLFQTERWSIMLRRDSAYFAGDTHSTLLKRKYRVGNSYGLTIRCNLKNYDSEIEQFLDWIIPYIDDTYDGFIGYMRCEEFDDPTLIYFDWHSSGYPIQLVKIVDGEICKKRPLISCLGLERSL